MPRTIATAITVSLFSALLAAAFPLNAAQGSTGMVVPAGITISTNEVLYVLGEAVQVTVQVQPPLDLNNLLRFNIYTPGGDVFRIAEFAINNDGHFVWTFDLPSSGAGQWIINAKFSTKDAEATIDVLEAGVFDKVFIESAALFDVRGYEMASGEGSGANGSESGSDEGQSGESGNEDNSDTSNSTDNLGPSENSSSTKEGNDTGQ